MEDISIIADGWINFIRSYSSKFPKSDKDKAEKRSEVCRKCPHLIKNTSLSAKIYPFKCEVCGCGFPVIVYSRYKKCPMEKW